MNKRTKYIVLFALFIAPLVFYVLISTGINNFAKLPVVTQQVNDISTIDKSKTFQEKISIICFLGDNVQAVKGGVFNFNQKIYKPFYGFEDFQVIAIYPEGNEAQINQLKKEIGAFTDMVKWKFIPVSKASIQTFYASFKTSEPLDNHLYSNKMYIVDRDLNLRGRTDEKEAVDGKLYGYNMQSVAELNNKMKDDIKVLLAEYRLLALKRNNKREI